MTIPFLTIFVRAPYAGHDISYITVIFERRRTIKAGIKNAVQILFYEFLLRQNIPYIRCKNKE